MKERALAVVLAAVVLFTPFWCKRKSNKAVYTFGNPAYIGRDLRK